MKQATTKQQLRQFGLIIGFGFPIFIGWLLPTLLGHGFRVWTLWIGGTGLILGLLSPRLLLYPFHSWMTLGHALGWVNSHIILGLVFIIVLQPIGYIMRLTGYDPLRRRQKGEKAKGEKSRKKKTIRHSGFPGGPPP